MAGSRTARSRKSPASERRGSTFTDKQIAQAVKDGRAVNVLLPDDSKVIGFVYGMDDYHWGLVTLDGRTVLVHKSAPSLEFTEYLLERQSEEIRERIEPIVGGYRAHVLETYFKARNVNS